MNIQEIKFKDENKSYSIVIGNNILQILPKRINNLCPKAKKIALIFDKKVPNKYKKIITRSLRKYELFIYDLNTSEKTKSLSCVTLLLNKLFLKNFNRTDLVIGIGGGITGDLVGFAASIFKRGISFISVPTTLLSQVDAAVGGKTGVNSNYGKNLIGTFSQPKLVVSDISFLKSLKKKEMICGYAEILKHSIIKDKKFFDWLKSNTRYIFLHDNKKLIYAIKKSCQIKMFFVNQDVNETSLRMSLNFGHTFAHAIEVKNNYSKKITHGEAVLTGMVLAIKLSILKKNCKKETLRKVLGIYNNNKLTYTLKNVSNIIWLKSLIPYLKNDKKNDDDKINFLLLKNIGKTEMPNKFKISTTDLRKYCKTISRY